MQAFVKLVKNNAYYKRFQVKYRRRRGMFDAPEVINTLGYAKLVENQAGWDEEEQMCTGRRA